MRKKKRVRISRLFLFAICLILTFSLIGSTNIAESPANASSIPNEGQNPNNSDDNEDKPPEENAVNSGQEPESEQEPEPNAGPDEIALYLYPPEQYPTLYSLSCPIPGANIPNRSSVLPNAPRSYRGGTHAGTDFYDMDMVNTSIYYGKKVYAAGSGIITRIDSEFVEMTTAYRTSQLNKAIAMEDKQSDEYYDILDQLGGRQVWIDHGDGVETRYLHLSGVNENLQVGSSVHQDDLIGYIGNSGTSDGALGNETGEIHLHFEIWLNGDYLGGNIDDWEIIRSLLTNILSK